MESVDQHARRALAALALAVALAPSRAGASDVAAAEALFRQGKALLEANNLTEACAKLAESQRLDPSSGTLLNLAHCHEKQGKLATAWAEFLGAARLSRSQKNEAREAEAQSRARALEPRVSYLIVKAERPIAGLTLRRDGVEMATTTLGERLPVDPGEHSLEASAPDHEPWSARVQISEASSQTVVIPALSPARPAASATPPAAPPAGPAASSAPAASSQPPAARPEPPQPGSRRLTGAVLAGAGLVVAAAGGYFGVRALSTYDKAESLCQTHRGCSPEAMSRRETASSEARLANLGVGAGLLLLGAGGYLLLTAPSGRVGLAPQVGPGQMGGALHGRF